MKKSFTIVAAALAFGLLTTNSSAYASSNDVVDNNNEIDPVVAQDGPKDGINDESSVNIKITKINKIPQRPNQDNPNTITPLAAGDWDYLGSSTFASQSKVFYSGGGNFKVYIEQPYKGPGFQWHYKLVEDDPDFDDTVKSFELPNEYGYYQVDFSVGSFVDGDNAKAELYMQKLTNPTTSVYSDWWD
jgi:hypothetical protein